MFQRSKDNGSTKNAQAKGLKSVKGLSTIRLEGGSQFGYYWVTLHVGSPPQPQTVLIHSQSQRIAFPCSMCKPGETCFKHTSPPFNYKASLTSKSLKCEEKVMKWHCGGKDCKPQATCKFNSKFGAQNTLSGWIFRDKIGLKADSEIQVGQNVTFMLKNKKKRAVRRRLVEHRRRIKFLKITHKQFPQFDAVFGCTQTETGFFKTLQTDGILGLGPHSNSITRPPTMVQMMHKSKVIKRSTFSLCFATAGGYMVYGGYNRTKHIPGEKPQRIKYSNNYRIKISRIIGHDHLVKQKKETSKNLLKKEFSGILDTGSSLTYLPAPAFTALQTQFNKFCSGHKMVNFFRLKFSEVCRQVKF
jgi:hypothetical protein